MRCRRSLGPLIVFASLNLVACGAKSAGEGMDASVPGESGNPDGSGSEGDASDGPVDAPSEIADGGETRPSACGCSYGYHHHCGPTELCMEGHGEPAMCQRPALDSETEQLLCTTAISEEMSTRPCNAQCVTAEVHVSPCSHRPGDIVSSMLLTWRDRIGAASKGPYLWNGLFDHLPGGMRPATNPIDQACDDFLGWSALGMLELCGGLDLVAPPVFWEELNDRRISQLPIDSCRRMAALTCISAVGNTIYGDRERVAAPVQRIREVCPHGLPFAPPCNDPDPDRALACVTAHVKSVARALRSGAAPAED